MTPKKTFRVRGMNIGIRVGMAVVAAVMSGPPQRSPLAGTTGDESPDELNGSTCLETAVGEIPVIKGSD
jgi:hypothetical protein